MNNNQISSGNAVRTQNEIEIHTPFLSIYIDKISIETSHSHQNVYLNVPLKRTYIYIDNGCHISIGHHPTPPSPHVCSSIMKNDFFYNLSTVVFSYSFDTPRHWYNTTFYILRREHFRCLQYNMINWVNGTMTMMW